MPELAVPVDGDPDWTLRLAGALFGDDQPLCCPSDLASDLISDLPDLELPELDLNELDADGFFGELKWYGEQATGLPERGGDDMEDSLLAVLAEGLSHIDGLAGLGGSDGAPAAVASDDDAQDGCSATAPGIHHRPVTPEEQASSSTNVLLTSSDQEDEEPSLLKKLLLAPPNSQQSYEHRVGGSVRCRVPPAERARLPLPFKPQALLKDCTSPSCSELLRHLCADDISSSLSNPKAWGGRGRQRRKATCTLASTAPQSKPPTCQQAKPSSLALPLTPESPGDAKSFASTFENKSLERTLSSELCSTAGLTPPTTPPHKQTLDTMVLCRSNPLVSTPCAGHGSEIPDSTAAHGANTAEQTMVSLRCPLAQSELYAQLRKAMGRPMSTTKGGRTGKKPGPRLFGDHDYCQAFNAALCSAAVAPVAVPFTPIVATGTVGVSQPSQAPLETGPTCGTMVDADVQSEWSDVRRCIHRCSSSAHYNLDNDEKVGKERRPKGDPYCLRPSGPGELGVVLKGTGHICSTPTLCSYSSHQQGDVTSDGESRVESAGPGEPSSWPGSACGSARQGTHQYSPQPNPACKVVSSAGRHPRNHRWQHSKFQFRRSACSSRLERCSRSRSRSPLAQVTRCGGHHGISQEISHRQDLEIPMEQISSGLECLGEKEEPCPQAKNRVDLFEGLQAGVLGVQDDREGVGQAEAGANVPHGNGEASVCGTFRHMGVMCAADRNLRKDSEEVDDTGLQCGKNYYADLDPTVDDFDPLDSKSKYDTMDFDSLLREAQGSLRR